MAPSQSAGGLKSSILCKSEWNFFHFDQIRIIREINQFIKQWKYNLFAYFEIVFLLNKCYLIRISIPINCFPMGMSLETVVVLQILCVETVVFFFCREPNPQFPTQNCWND